MLQNKNIKLPAIADTADWHLSVFLRHDSLSAYLINIADEKHPVYKVVSVGFQPGVQLLSQIESAVYDNPLILDDFSSDIIISSDFFSFIPTEIYNFSEELSEQFVSPLFPGIEAEELFFDKSERVTVAYFLVAGLKHFLGRTFPGARISSEMMTLYEKFSTFTGGGTRIYVDWEDDYVSLFGFSGKNLIFASRYHCDSEIDLCYYLLNVINVYGLDSSKTEVYVTAPDDKKNSVISSLRKHADYVVSMLLSSEIKDCKAPLPVALKFSRFRKL